MKNIFSKFIRYIQSLFAKTDLSDIVANKGAQILDVRTEAEYANHGSIKNSVNIPLDNLRREISRLDKDKPVIVYCANGMRSGLARQILLKSGFKEVHKGGSYRSLKNKL